LPPVVLFDMQIGQRNPASLSIDEFGKSKCGDDKLREAFAGKGNQM
jgi:hypothetical protein